MTRKIQKRIYQTATVFNPTPDIDKGFISMTELLLELQILQLLSISDLRIAQHKPLLYQNVSESIKPYLIDSDWVRLRMVRILYGYDRVQESEELLYDFQKIT